MRHEQVDRAKHEAENASTKVDDTGNDAPEDANTAASADATKSAQSASLPRITHGLKTIGAGGPQEVIEYFFEQSFQSKQIF